MTNRLDSIKAKLSTISSQSKDPYEILQKLSCEDLGWMIKRIDKLENQLRSSLVIAYEDTSDRYYLNVLDEIVPGWELGCGTISKKPEDIL